MRRRARARFARSCFASACCAAGLLLAAAPGAAQGEMRGAAPGAEASPEQYASPSAGDDFPRNVYWGDTHLHTRLSFDANVLGNDARTAEDAYRLARGERVLSQNGKWVRLRRPLDFLVVSDHAEYLGVMHGLREKNRALRRDPVARRWSEWLETDPGRVIPAFIESLQAARSQLDVPKFDRYIWKQVVSEAERFNEPGRFTTFIGYEWTSMPEGDNLHRVVLLRDGAERALKTRPFSVFDSEDPGELWKFLQRYEEETGGAALSIPHNSNLSGGRMFALAEYDGGAWSAERARLRARFERLVEATQYKGDSETHPYLSPEDEFADFERWDASNIAFSQPHRDEWFAGEYLRSGLLRGLLIESRIGVNPFRFGMIGSTDSHTALATADEDDFWSKFSDREPGPERWNHTLTGTDLEFQVYEWQMAASGYAAVWARSNTREAIFDAMARRETYATTGPRMVVRVFAGFDFAEGDEARPDLPRHGYRHGVPMGGVLPPVGAGRGFAAPKLLISALKDPEGANLDRIQVVKGRLNSVGELHERVHDVALSDGRRVNRRSGRAPALSQRHVDVEKATWQNSVGAASLSVLWTDPDFDPEQPAFYYVRVLEIPTPRWTAYDAERFDLELPEEVPLVIQERAYTSPIWYLPAADEAGATDATPTETPAR